MRQGTLVVALLLLVSGAATAAPAPKEHPAKAELLADVAAIQPGKPFHLAVRITLQKDWHVYWINPGDSGQPTEVKFNLPAGWTVEPLPFPIPKSFTLPGDIINYGYSDSVLLMARVTPPAGAKGTVELSADAEWLVCNDDRCIPGKAKSKLSLPVESASRPDNQQLFAEWQAKLPRVEAFFGVTLQPTNGAVANLRGLGRDPNAEVKNVEVFLAPGAGWMVGRPQVQTTGNDVKIQFEAKPVGKNKKPAELQILYVYDEPDGVRRGLLMNCQLTP